MENEKAHVNLLVRSQDSLLQEHIFLWLKLHEYIHNSNFHCSKFLRCNNILDLGCNKISRGASKPSSWGKTSSAAKASTCNWLANKSACCKTTGGGAQHQAAHSS
jgi:hypothetical protein